METFDFPYHAMSLSYPATSTKITFGKGYEFVSRPTAPPQILYRLTFPAMWWYVNPITGTIDLSSDPDRNIGVLKEFYERHELFKKFIYPHPNLGTLYCRFNDPLEIPSAGGNGDGKVENITISLRKIP